MKSARKPGFEAPAFGELAELSVGWCLGVGVDGFGDGEFLFGMEGHRAGFVLACDGGVQTVGRG